MAINEHPYQRIDKGRRRAKKPKKEKFLFREKFKDGSVLNWISIGKV